MQEKIQNAKVTKDHISIYPKPIKLTKDEQVSIGKKDCEWKGWVWCKAKSGIEGWVPEKYLSIENDRAIAKKDYDATELNVKKGDRLVVHNEESGWCWSQKKDGTTGWVPSENLQIIE